MLRSKQQALRAIQQAAETARDSVSSVPRVWFTVDTIGEVIEAEIGESSGRPGADSAAVIAALKFRFEPARRGGQKICSSVLLPVAIPATMAS